VGDLETSKIRRPWPALGCCGGEKNYLEFIQKILEKKNSDFS
jgi:hypothetical protein